MCQRPPDPPGEPLGSLRAKVALHRQAVPRNAKRRPFPSSMPTTSPWFEMPSPFDLLDGRLLLLEPPWANDSELRMQLLDQSYPKPFVLDDGERRYLYFTIHLMQSAMRLATPNALDLRYTQKMIACLLFNPRPRRVVLIGLGGGSLVKFFHYQLPSTHLTAIELNPDVIALRDAFLLPPDGPKLQVLQTDGAEYLITAEKGIDVLLIDAFDKSGFAPTLASRTFLETAFAKLAGSGQLVINLAGDRERYEGLIGDAMEVFDDRVIVVPVREDGNHVLLAFKDTGFAPNWRRVHAQAKQLRRRFDLDFPVFAQKIEHSAKLRFAEREAGRDR
jgi:spermidine synthase